MLLYYILKSFIGISTTEKYQTTAPTSNSALCRTAPWVAHKLSTGFCTPMTLACSASLSPTARNSSRFYIMHLHCMVWPNHSIGPKRSALDSRTWQRRQGIFFQCHRHADCKHIGIYLPRARYLKYQRKTLHGSSCIARDRRVLLAIQGAPRQIGEK